MESRDGLAGLYPEWRPSRYSDRELRRKDFDPILHGIVREQYGNLDPFVERFDESYRCGTSTREVFLSCFELYHRIGGSGAARYFPTYEKNVRTWMEMKPDSQVPVLTLAGLLKSQAWLSRGEDTADRVTEEGWKGFSDNLQRSRAVLENAPDFVKEDPHYWYQLLGIGLGQGVAIEEMKMFFREGQKRDAKYLPLYKEMVWYLQPRWHGTTDTEWHEFLIEAIEVETLNEEDRKMVYGIVVRYILRGMRSYGSQPGKTFEYMGIDIPMFLEGLSIFTRRFPDSSEWPIHYFYHAAKADDLDAMKEAIELAAREFDPYRYKEDTILSMFESAVKRYPELAEVLGRKS